MSTERHASEAASVWIESGEVSPEKGSDGNSPGFHVFSKPPGGAVQYKEQLRQSTKWGRGCDAAVKLTRKWMRVSAQPKT